MQRRSAKGSIRLCTVLGDLVPMGFRASVCIYVIDTNCLPEGERIGSALCGCPYGFWRTGVVRERPGSSEADAKPAARVAGRKIATAGTVSASRRRTSHQNLHSGPVF